MNVIQVDEQYQDNLVEFEEYQNFLYYNLPNLVQVHEHKLQLVLHELYELLLQYQLFYLNKKMSDQ